MKRVYIETSIPSFFFEIRKEPEMVARQTWTCEWWDRYRKRYELVTSPAVIAELEEGEYPTQAEALALAAEIPQIEVPDEIAEIVETYIANRLMPKERSGDAIHLALASWHKCDFLLTWNCKHIANANKFAHIRIINNRLGLFVPALVTPMELCSEDTP
ncbi:type II toxin-antitoxin system VapC family toxin [Candidatus Electronema sp. TJ]|uniref:type II toxin-antitoxin system VapC family toxin n=1 Tax=Candidatus Electronema sp. TJ TaxID=3401573 RepID=UPI003AA9A18F